MEASGRMIYQNTAEGQAANTALTAANSGGGSGDPFTSVTIGSGAAIVYSTASTIHGAQSYAVTGTNNTATYVTWDGFNDTQIAVRCYYNPGATLPNAAMRFIDIRSSSTSLARLSITAANRLFMQDYNGTNTKWTASAPLDVNTWYRLEIVISVSATTATMKCAYYVGDSTNAVQEYSTTTGNTGSAAIASVRFISAQNAPWTTTSYFDDFVADSGIGTSYVGPSAVAASGFLKNNAEGQPNGTQLTSQNSGGISGDAFGLVSIGSGAALAFSSATSAHGSQSYALTSSNGTGTYVEWNTFNDTAIAARTYFNIGSTLPNVGLRFIDIRSATTSLTRLSLNSSNRLFVQDYNGTNTKWTASAPLQVDTWYRLELAISVSATTAKMKCAYYLGDSTTPVQVYTTTTGNTGTENIATVRLGSGQGATWTGTTYFDDLAVSNQGGAEFIGPYSTTTRPGKPLNATATVSSGQAVVTFDEPAYTGGLAITGYTATSTPGALTASIVGPSAAPITIPGLSNGTSYTFTVHATNSAGNGSESDPTAAVVPASLPGAPTSVSASVSSGQTLVSFSPPSSDGGSPITSYVVTSSPGAITISGVSSPITMTGLTNGVSYTFTVSAVTDSGTGPASTASNAVTPFLSSRRNTAEGQASGTALTAANSGGGSGDALSVVTVGSGASLVFSNTTSVQGTNSYALTNASGTATTMSWTGFNDTSIAARVYYNPGSSTPNAAMRLIDIRNSTTSMARLSLNSSNQLFMQDYNGASTKWTGSTPLQANTWYRLELVISVSSSAATMKCDYYILDSSAPVATGYSTTTGNTGSANITTVNFGSLQGSTWTGTSYFDNLAVDVGTNYVGAPLIANAGSPRSVEPWTRVILDGSASSGSVSSWSWAFKNGTSVSLDGSGAIVSFVAPAVLGGTTSTFTLTVVDAQGTSVSQDVTITSLPPNNYYLNSSGTWTPLKITSL